MNDSVCYTFFSHGVKKSFSGCLCIGVCRVKYWTIVCIFHLHVGSTVGGHVHLQSVRIFLSVQCKSSLPHVSLF